MAIVIADRVKETTTTTGTGTVDLAGAATGYRGFVAGAGAAAVVYYTIAGQAGGGAEGEWEVGIGTVTDAAPDTLSRTTILSSSNAGAAVDFSAGTKDVFLSLPAHSVGFMGALVRDSAAETTVTTVQEVLDWDTEIYDVGGWHESVTNPSRLTVPAGVDWVRISAQVMWTQNKVGQIQAVVLKGGVATANIGLPYSYLTAASGSDGWFTNILTSGPLPVVAGNYFEIRVWQNSGGNLDIAAGNTWFAIEKVGP